MQPLGKVKLLLPGSALTREPHQVIKSSKRGLHYLLINLSTNLDALILSEAPGAAKEHKMKYLTLLGLAIFASGCSLFTQPPSEAAARRLEQGRAGEERSVAIAARASQYEKQGMTSREANALAETEYHLSARP